MEPETVRVGLFYVVDLPTEFKVYNDKKIQRESVMEIEAPEIFGKLHRHSRDNRRRIYDEKISALIGSRIHDFHSGFCQ